MGKGKLYRGAAVPYLLGALLVVSGCDGPSAPAPVASVEIVASADTLEEGGTLQLQGVLRGWGGSVLEGREIGWTTSNERVATVSPTGLVTALAAGPVTITATAEEISAQATFMVRWRRIYRVQYLGDVPGMAHTAARAINEGGQVVVIGWNGEPHPTRRHGEGIYLWEGGSLRLVTVGPPGAREMIPVGITNDGMIGGSFRFDDVYAFRWERGQLSFQRVPDSRPYLTTAKSMNRRGDIVGSGGLNTCTRACSGQSFLFRSTGELIILPNRDLGVEVPEGYRVLLVDARDINDAGQITGTLFLALERHSERQHAFRMDGGRIDLLPWSDLASAGNAIDARGMVGGYSLGPLGIQPAVWSPGEDRRLAPMVESIVAAVTRLNDQGVAVGYSLHSRLASDYGHDQIPVLFRDGHTIRLSELYEVGEWLVTVVDDLNERGQMVGRARHRTTGAIGAVLLTPLDSTNLSVGESLWPVRATGSSATHLLHVL